MAPTIELQKAVKAKQVSEIYLARDRGGWIMVVMTVLSGPQRTLCVAVAGSKLSQLF